MPPIATRKLRWPATLLAVAAVTAAGCGSDETEGATAPAATAPATAAAEPAPAPEQRPEPGPESAPEAGRPPARAARTGRVVKVIDSPFGRVIADRKGEAVYLFDREKGRRSACYGACAVAWPPMLTKGRPRAAKGARQGLLGTTRRRDGTRQVTYDGHPLYYYQGDSPGNIRCQAVDEFGGLWLVVRPDGDAVA